MGKASAALQASVALAKKGNVERHFKMLHSKTDTDFPLKSNLRKQKVQQLKHMLLTQQKMFTRPAEKNIATTVASYRVSQVIARRKKPFEDAMFVRMVFSDFEVKEELVKIIPLKGHTRGEDIYSKVKEYLISENIQIQKLVSITTDGAPAFTGRTNGFLALCRKDSSFPKFFSYHCIIHQQALCAKFLNMNDVIKTVIKIAHSLQRRLFRELIEELELQHGELPFHTEVRWLSKGKVLYRFNQLLPAILTFLKERNEETFVGILEDSNWLQDFAFLVDITEKLNDLNLKLQGKDKHILEMISEVKAFSEKLTLWEKNVMRGELKHFPTLNKQIETAEIPYERERFFNIITSLKEEFEKRFSDFKRIELVCQFVLFPLSNINVEESVADPINLWPVVPNEKYPHLISVAQQVKAFFPSTYLCESTFSSMNFIKNKYRTRLTDDHLDSCIRHGVTNYSPDFKKIVDESECQVSH
ncbi:hypothetical protein GDO86_003847 [Hymenochirus boettgeri]|uniref:HAT C-terminal dimerisation domain-containing protein n=1 Tax=Hymenochirus boettgeri TaxID=247094 RepID=A0A8T2K5V6_9PIPI|nr:hypothetical protein GDO86_003847 [Hymenochirus boettgeri]